MPKTIRFGDLVRQSGRPEVLTLWTDPKRDKRLTKAIRENRVLTVIQEPTGKKKDFGHIGFHRDPHASWLVFPRPLAERGSGRVIGINYELAEDAEPEGPLAVTQPDKRRRRVGTVGGSARRAQPAASPKSLRVKQPVARPFTVIIKRRAELETAVEVKALNEQAACEQALARLRRKRFDGARAVVRDEVISVR